MTAAVSPQLRTRKRLRGFILVWTFVTLVMGFATFIAIYFAYPLVTGLGASENVALPPQDNGADVVLVQPSITPAETAVPTEAPTEVPAEEETEEPVEVAQEPTLVAQSVQASTPTPEPTVPPVDVDHFEAGIQVQYSLDFNPDNQDGFYRSVADDLGLPWVKQQVRWEDFEREPGQIDYAILDFVMPSAERFGLKMALSIVTAPDWAREQGVELGREGPPADISAYVNFVTSIVQRYPGQVHAIEVWNEQNLDREWTSTGGLSAANYVEMLRQTYTAVKAIDPNVIIISGALSQTGINDGVMAVDDFVYLEQMIAAGMLDYADCVGSHVNGFNIGPAEAYNEVVNDPTAQFRGPFDNPHHSWSFRSTLEGYRNRIVAANYDVPLCVTEFGWAVGEDLEGVPEGFGFALDNTLAEQASWIPEAMSMMDNYGWVRLGIIWNFNYAPQAGWDPNNDNVPYSLIGPNFQFRPAYDAVRSWQSAYNQRMQSGG
ncbi:MAG: hypothetical protein H6670_04775 [Anaerolineaceae bacterium]|nr:hypothetical protein [Anaerolineae bacterium]MCB9458940.1 hypothetical protein [Anaerolineaceae bacterium]